MTQLELSAFVLSETIECPKGCGGYENLHSHWRQTHDAPFPENTPTISKSLSALHSKNREGVGNPNYGNTHSEEAIEKMTKWASNRSGEYHKRISETLSGRNLSKEHRKAISEGLRGIPRSEECKRKQSETVTGEGNPFYGKSHTEEHREKMKMGRTRCAQIIPTRHIVRSGWEHEIDLLLYDNNLDFEYEPGPFKITKHCQYTPDFRVGKDIIEVKGALWNGSVQRSARFMRSHPEYRYIVVGTKLPADVHIPWKDRERLIDVVAD